MVLKMKYFSMSSPAVTAPYFLLFYMRYRDECKLKQSKMPALPK